MYVHHSIAPIFPVYNNPSPILLMHPLICRFINHRCITHQDIRSLDKLLLYLKLFKPLESCKIPLLTLEIRLIKVSNTCEAVWGKYLLFLCKSNCFKVRVCDCGTFLTSLSINCIFKQMSQ